MKIIKTNWINLLGVFTAVFVYAIFLNLTDINVSRNLFQSILPALMLVCLYGILFWVLLILLLVLFDLIFFVRDQTNLTVKLLVEWLIISSVHLLGCKVSRMDIYSRYCSLSHNAIYPTEADKKLCKGLIDKWS